MLKVSLTKIGIHDTFGRKILANKPICIGDGIRDSLIDTYLPYLFTYQQPDCKGMPNTNNKIEGTFTDLKKKLKFNVGIAGHDHDQAVKLGELMNKEVGTTETIKFGPIKKGERFMNFELDKLDMFKVSRELSPYTQKDRDNYHKEYGLDSTGDSYTSFSDEEE